MQFIALRPDIYSVIYYNGALADAFFFLLQLPRQSRIHPLLSVGVAQSRRLSWITGVLAGPTLMRECGDFFRNPRAARVCIGPSRLVPLLHGGDHE